MRTVSPSRFIGLVTERVAAAAKAQTPADRYRCLCDLDHLLLCDLLTSEEQAAVLDLPEVAGVMRESQLIYGPFETTLECSMVNTILGSPHASLDPARRLSVYLQRYRKLSEREVALAKITEEDRVLCIGSGPLPITAIEYQRLTGCRATCIDCLPEAIEISISVLEHLGLTQQVTPRHARGEDCAVAGYSVILVGVLAEPKDVILRHLDREADDSCRILCRTTLGVRSFIYPRTIPRKLDRFRPTEFSQADGDQVISTQLLTSTGTAAQWEQDGTGPMLHAHDGTARV